MLDWTRSHTLGLGLESDCVSFLWSVNVLSPAWLVQDRKAEQVCGARNTITTPKSIPTHGYGWNSHGYSREACKCLRSVLRSERRGERGKDSCLIVLTTSTRCYLYTLLLLVLCLPKSSKSCHACCIPHLHKVQRTLRASRVFFFFFFFNHLYSGT